MTTRRCKHHGVRVRATNVRTADNLVSGEEFDLVEYIPSNGGACPTRPAVIVRGVDGKRFYFHAYRFETIEVTQ